MRREAIVARSHARSAAHHLTLRWATSVIIVSLVVTTALFWTGDAAEAVDTETFRLTPHPLRVHGYERRSFELDVEPGAAVTDAIRLTNKTDSTRRFRLAARDAQRHTTTGALSVGSRGSDPRGIGSWVELQTDEVELGPHGSQIVAFTLERPVGTELAGMGAIVAEEIRDANEGGVDVVYRLAIIIRLGGEAPGLKASEPELDIPLALAPTAGIVRSHVKNDTLAPLSAKITFSVSSLTGRTWKLEPQQVLLEPGEERLIEAPWDTVPRWGGIMRGHVEVGWQAGNLRLSGPRGMYPPLWLLALAIIAIGVRGVQEMWSRRPDQKVGRSGSAPDPDALRRRLIEAAMWLRAAGQDAPRELRETTAAEAQAVAAEARRTKGARDIEHAARSLAAFANGLGGGDRSVQNAAHEFDEWLREHRDDPHVEELVGA